MKRVSYRKYTKEFRLEAVKLLIDGHLSIPEVGKRLSLAPSTLSTWVKAYRTGQLEEVGRKTSANDEYRMTNSEFRSMKVGATRWVAS